MEKSAEEAVLKELLTSTVASTGEAGRRLALCVVATAATLRRELSSALKGVARSAKSGKDYRSPGGSCFAAAPLASDKASPRRAPDSSSWTAD